MRALLFALFMLCHLHVLAASANQTAPLAVGQQAPDFTLSASLNGQDFSFSLPQALAQGPVVVYFFPSAFTQGCDLEAHTFATQINQFKAVGASVIGVSADSLQRLHEFSQDPNFCAGQFPVASDADGKVAARFGLVPTAARSGMTDVRGHAVTHLLIPRTTFVIAQDGRVLARMSSRDDQLTPIDHVEQSLAIVTRLNAQPSR